MPASPPQTPLDVDALRADTPGCAQRAHLNNAGAGLMPRPVLAAVQEHLTLESTIGGYEAADARAEAIAEAYRAVAELIGCAPRNVAMVESATVAVALALSAIPFAAGDLILTSRHDYASNQIMFLSLARRLGVEVARVGDAPEGGIDVEALAAAMRARRPRLVALTEVPTSSGLVQPAAAVGRLCREHRVPYLLDACQSVGQLPRAPAPSPRAPGNGSPSSTVCACSTTVAACAPSSPPPSTAWRPSAARPSCAAAASTPA